MSAQQLINETQPLTCNAKLWAATRVVARSVLPAALILFAAPFVALLFFSLPNTDDLCNATLSFNCVPQHSVLAITWLYYTQWSPRWLTTFTQTLLMSHFDLVRDYGFLLLLVIVSNVSGLWYFFWSVFRVNWGKSLLAAGVFYAAWVASLPHPGEILYWLTGALGYNLSLTTLLVLIALLCRPRKEPWYYLLIALLSIAAPAQHEMAGAFLCAFVLVGAIAMRVTGRPARPWYLSLMFGALSQAAVMLSPGNAVRAAQEHRRLWDFAHLPSWVGHSVYHGLNWLSYSSFLMAIVCILLLFENSREATGAAPLWLPLALFGGMIVILGEYCLVELASGTWAPDRVVVWFQFLFWLLFVCAVLTGVPDIFRGRFSAPAQIVVFGLFAITLLGSTNFRSALEDLHGPAEAWRRIDAARLRQRGGNLEFEAPAQYPKLAMHPQLTADRSCWVNRCLANYLKADSVVVKNSTEECPH